ncbi:VacJ family lipoprotein [uncultured Marinobacter sp.]|jgi:phospholipid-binding lipoprotein MlaA|uniref:MlaA family lipoprotein n=1 Tax=uncultured Marinobacter sp. TaxID=187379 RepID=UPI002599A0CA|nr:VacJ family lipoprotein [uncultured Marinobacter sp.]|tara:strand:- start:198 stop:977 length:780 start_codon:yes stop_codon:yes gene_type:complete
MREFDIRRWAPGMLLFMALALGATAVQAQNLQEPPMEGEAMPANTDDPYENWNRKVYAFNDAIDRWFLRPVASGYRTVTPDIVDRGVTNFFNNLTEIRNFTNSLLQLKGESAVVAFGRFTFNTVFGLGGIFDVATAWDLPERPEDFGQTLGHWGVGSGPYLMLPLLGPSTPRHFSGLASDSFMLPSAWDAVDSPEWYYLRTLQIVDKRADLIPAESFISGDQYTFVRNAFLQRREFLINDGKITEDPFADDDDFMLEDF